MLKQKIDHKESLALAKQHLGFTCKKEEAAYVNSLLRCLKRMFVYRTGCLKVINPSKDSELSSKADGRDYSNPTSGQQHVNTEVEDLLRFQEASDAQVIAESGVSPEFQLAQRDLLKSINESEKKFDKQLTKLTKKQKEEMKQLKHKYEDEKTLLENKKRTEVAVIRLHSNNFIMTDKMRNLNSEYARKFDELKQRMDIDLKNLEASQVAARSNVLERKTLWVEAVKTWARVELAKPPISKAILPETVSPTDALENVVPFEACSREEILNGTTSSKPNKEVPLKTAESVILCEGQNNLASVQVRSSENNSDIYKLTNIDGEVPLKEPLVANFNAGQETHVSAEAPSSEKIPDGAALGKAVGDIYLRTTKTVNSSGGQENILLLEAPSPGENPVGTTSSNLDGKVQLRAAETVRSREDHENLPSLVAPSSEKVSCGTTLTMVDGELALNASEVCQGNIISANTSSEKEILGGATLNVLDGEVPNISSEIANSSDDMNNIVCTNLSTSKEQEQIPDTAALSMPAEEISLAEPETACSELLEGGSANRENDGTCAIEIDQLDGLLHTMDLEPEFEERSLADPSSLQAVADLVYKILFGLFY